MTTIYLIRHTEVAVGKSVCYGGTDVELADNYAAQALGLVRHLPDKAPDVVFSSPLSRCRQLAEDLVFSGFSTSEERLEVAGKRRLTGSATESPISFKLDDRLREYHFGDWEMQPWSAIPREELDAWMVDFVNLAPHYGDSFQEVYDRVSAFWRDEVLPLADAEQPKTVYIVSHGGVIRALLCLILELPLQNAYRLHLDYGAVSKLAVQNGTYTVAYINR
ncbi:alpha-ribazole phosphatase family protein [Fibrella aquatica]|uniref:alpha-ribazole phosphatase family protein n=1 Tax=Fibrella aquatica TaxID=3242487 RepID=UPI003522F494